MIWSGMVILRSEYLYILCANNIVGRPKAAVWGKVAIDVKDLYDEPWISMQKTWQYIFVRVKDTDDLKCYEACLFNLSSSVLLNCINFYHPCHTKELLLLAFCSFLLTILTVVIILLSSFWRTVYVLA